MSLKIKWEKATDQQIKWLKEHKYYGTLILGKNQATRLIEEYIEQEKLEMTQAEREYFKRIKNING